MLSMLLVSILSSLSALAYDVEIDGIYYNITSKTKQAEVTSGDIKYSGDIVIPSSIIVGDVEYVVTEIGNKAFEKCGNLLSVSMPNSLIAIGDESFFYCSRLSSIVIPNSVTSVGSSAFSKCGNLTTVSISNSLAIIGNNVFEKCTNLSTMSIPSSVIEIGIMTFKDCTNLLSVKIPNSIKKIGQNAFYGCINLKKVYISDITAWCNIDFYDVSSTPLYNTSDLYLDEQLVTDLVLPNTVNKIKKCAFRGCSSIKTVIIPSSVDEIGGDAFKYCTNLTSLVIPNSVETIGDLAFDGCTNLRSIKLPNSLNRIGVYAFRDCTNLSSITIPSSVLSIDYKALSGCRELTDVYCYAEKVPKTDSSAFSGSYIEYATLHVPEAAMSEYQTTEPWSGFGSFKTLEGTEVEKKQCATPVVSYSDGKLQFMCDTPDAECYYTLTVPDAKTNNTFVENNTVTLSACYDITCYAIATGYEESKKATAKLYLLPSSGILEDTAINVAHRGVAVQSSNGFIYISGLDDNETVSLYSLDGKTLGTVTSASGYATFPTPRASTVIVRIGSTSIKVATE